VGERPLENRLRGAGCGIEALLSWDKFRRLYASTRMTVKNKMGQGKYRGRSWRDGKR
jgi:hypothetical protein